MYILGFDGYCGDEDNGQIFVWYVFLVFGFYLVCLGIDEYVIGVFLFKKVMLYFENGNNFVIDVQNNSKENFYIEFFWVNG